MALVPNEFRVDCPSHDYVTGVIEGRLPACKWIKLACKRHLDDLATAHERGLWWDQSAADHAIEFFGFLRHSKGKWNDAVFELAGWQAFIVSSIFGWKRANGLRRFKIAFVEVPRKNGKTTLAAGIALYLLVCDGEAGAEIYSAATKRDQAKLVFEDAKAMVGRSPEIAEIVERFTYSLQIPEARSKFEPLGADADTADGLNPFVAVCDEIHAWKTRDLWDVLLTGMGAREQPMALAITTAGDFADSIYNELHGDTEQILEGVVKNAECDDVFGFIACLDPEDDWRDSTKWAKANPNLGVSLFQAELANTIKSAERQPSSQNKVKRNRLGIRTAALDSWLRLDQWDRGGQSWDVAELLGRQCFGAIDLASTSDLAALVLAFPWEGERGQQGQQAYRLRCWFWCPADTDNQPAEKLRRRIFPWSQAGLVEMTPGGSIDHGCIEDAVKEAAKLYEIKTLCFDPYNCESTANRLAAEGVNCIRFPQNSSNYNEPTRAFENAVIAGRLHHNNNPVLRWMASNAVVLENGAGLRMPSRKRSREKIDGVVAAVMAIGAYLKTPLSDGASVYETRGFD